MSLRSDIDMFSFWTWNGTVKRTLYKLVVAPALRKTWKMYGKMPVEKDAVSKVWSKYQLSIAIEELKQPSNSHKSKGL